MTENNEMCVQPKDTKCEDDPLIKIQKRAKIQLLNSYDKISLSYNELIVNALLSNGKCHLVALFKDYLIQDDVSEFLKRQYKRYESTIRLKKLINFYNTTSVIYPNYTPVVEAKFIYKNVMQKQKLIDQQQEIEDMQKYLKKHQKKIQKEKDIVFNTEAYEEIINESNSFLINMLGLDANTIKKNALNDSSDDEDKDKIMNLINAIKNAEYITEQIVPKNNYNKTKLMIDDKTRLKLKLDSLNKIKIQSNTNNSNVTTNISQNKNMLSMSIKSNSPTKPLKIETVSRNKRTESLTQLSTTTRRSKGKHQSTLSMPKISIKRTPKIKHKFKLLVDNNNMLKTLSTAAVTSPSYQETTNRFHTKTKSIIDMNQLKCHQKNLINNFRSPPASDRGIKMKKMIHIQKMEQLNFPTKSKFLGGNNGKKGNLNIINQLTERYYN